MNRVVLIALLAAAAVSCKARPSGESRALSAETEGSPAAGGNAAESIPGLGVLLDHVEADLDQLGTLYASGDGLRLPEGDGFALNDARPAEIQEALALAAELQAMARELVLHDQGRVTSLALQLEALGQLSSDQLTADET